jgi:hypothetical protein
VRRPLRLDAKAPKRDLQKLVRDLACGLTLLDSEPVRAL